MWDLVLLRRITSLFLSDDKQKRVRVFTFPLNPPLGNVGLGPASQDNISIFV